MIKPERKKKEEKRKPTRTSNKMTISTYLSIIPLYVNRKNVPIKRHGVADQIKKKKRPNYMLDIIPVLLNMLTWMGPSM